MHKAWPLLSLAVGCSTSTAPSELTSTLEHRLSGDRTGACVAVALIADGASERSTVCAGRHRDVADDAFEIGSISKTMTGFLIASLIAEGKLALSDPLERYLPAGTVVPRFQDLPITIDHLLTHTSGLPPLPSRFQPADLEDPYADVTEAMLFASLADVQLSEPPGTSWAYSNYAYMLLSYIASTLAQKDLEAALTERLFSPLGMRAFVGHRPSGVNDAKGHLALGIATKAWTFPPKLAGLGGVHATLDDMIRYAEAMLGSGDPATVAMLARASEVVRQPSEGPAMGFGWVQQRIGEHTLLVHDGGTGGFSSLIAIERESGRAVVALSDTSFSSVGGLSELALHVLVPDAVPLDLPRKVATPTPDLLNELVGTYALGELPVTMTARNGKLYVQAEAQPELELGFDSYGAFFPRMLIDATLVPVRAAGGPTTFDWMQGGGVTRAVRVP